jgi:CRISPR system Cascade subunit CasE
MYLSRLLLDVRAGITRRFLSDVNYLHQQVLAAFPEGLSPAAPRAALGVLFRLERIGDGRLILIVQSAAAPDWRRFPLSALVVADHLGGDGTNPAVKEVGAQFASLTTGMPLRFRLRANPTKKVDTKTGPDGRRRNGRRVALNKEADREQWLARKGEQHGFRVSSVSVAGRDTPDLLDVSEGRAQGYRPAASEGHGTMTFGSALFEGILVVTDAGRFREALRTGVGSGKAFGFGLLSVAPAERG